MLKPNELTCWVVTDGTIGMENQCLGLAEALNLKPIVKHVRLKAPWKQLAPFWRHGLAKAFTSESDPLDAPYPNLLLASGRSGAMAALHIRRLTRKLGASRTFTVHIQNPVIDPSRFDLVAVPRHDNLWGENVITTRGSLHRVTPEKLQAEATKLELKLSFLPEHRIAVVIGGSNSVYQFSTYEMNKLVAQLRSIAKSGDTGFMVTTSRRTGEKNMSLLKEALKDIPHFLWDGQPPNPYYGMLGLAEAILVTADSANMVSEACSTGKPVHVIPLSGGSDKFRRFHQTLYDDGMTRPFKGILEKWSYTPLNDPQLVAQRIRYMLAKEGIVEGD